MKAMTCKCCNDRVEVSLSYDESFCDQYCAKVFNETLNASMWRTVLSFALDRKVKPEEELVINVTKSRQRV